MPPHTPGAPGWATCKKGLTQTYETSRVALVRGGKNGARWAPLRAAGHSRGSKCAQ